MKECFYWCALGFVVSATVALAINVTTCLAEMVLAPFNRQEVAEVETIHPPKAPAPQTYAHTVSTYQARNTITDEIKENFGHEWKLALSIAKAESGLNPRAVNYNRNGTKDLGVFQINDCHYFSDADRLDWRKNIRLAKWIRDTYGWKAWVAYNKGSYRQYYREEI